MLKNQSITNKIKIVGIIVVLVVIFLLLTEITGAFRTKHSVMIDIPKGSSGTEIINLLEQNNVVGSKTLFKIYSKRHSVHFKAGKHIFDKKSYGQIIKTLKADGIVDSIRVTIPEGYEQREIALLMQEKGLCTKEEFLSEAKTANFPQYWFLKDIPQRKYELEGYLFPDTYDFTYVEGAKSIINKMLSNFENKITDEMRSKAKKLDMSFDDIITMASVVEREAASGGEYPLVAGVFYNRIKSVGETNGLMQSCATVQYILEERKSVLSLADTKINSPYNTYINKGLPIGPIASPGIETINAALYPEKTDYLYFVADGKGTHYFAKTHNEHLNNMRKAGL